MSLTNPIARLLDSPKAPSFEVFELGELTVRTDRGAGEWVIAAYGELDLASAGLFDREVNRAIDEAQNVVLDLSALQFIDSTGLNSLIRAARRAAARSRSLDVLRPPPDVERVFGIAGVDQVIAFLD